MEYARRLAAIAVFAVSVASCTTPPPAETSVSVPPVAGVYKVGQPYQIQGTWYYPREQPSYDETGIASWYGPTFEGHRTANGEMYNPEAMTAAHRTLPMPVNARVTNLQNGKSVIVRINDRGPYSKGRIIDLSAAAARALDVVRTGTARVRVTYASAAMLPNGEIADAQTPPEIASALPPAPAGKVDTAALDAVPGATEAPPVKIGALPVPSTLATLESRLNPASLDNQPTGAVTHVPVPAMTHLYVQLGAFANAANANRLKKRLGSESGLFISPIDRSGQKLYRVRSGPYDDVASADTALARIIALGNNDAQIIVDQ